jgi:hypothetical protein
VAEVKSAEQVREEYLRAMGPELGAVFYALWNELEISWELFSAPGDAEVLVYRLAAARLAEEKRFKRLWARRALPDDLEEPGEV